MHSSRISKARSHPDADVVSAPPPSLVVPVDDGAPVSVGVGTVVVSSGVDAAPVDVSASSVVRLSDTPGSSKQLGITGKSTAIPILWLRVDILLPSGAEGTAQEPASDRFFLINLQLTIVLLRPLARHARPAVVDDGFERRTLGYVAANVRKFRHASELTQAQLAEAVGIEPRFLQAIEAASFPPSFKNLIALAGALGVEVRDLFTPEKPAVRNPGRPPKNTAD